MEVLKQELYMKFISIFRDEDKNKLMIVIKDKELVKQVMTILVILTQRLKNTNCSLYYNSSEDLLTITLYGNPIKDNYNSVKDIVVQELNLMSSICCMKCGIESYIHTTVKM